MISLHLLYVCNPSQAWEGQQLIPWHGVQQLKETKTFPETKDSDEIKDQTKISVVLTMSSSPLQP